MDIRRRDALQLMGRAALAVAVSPLLNACSGPARSAVSGRDESVPGLDPTLADVLYHASLAPSGHNTQPWVVNVPEPNRLLIGTARDRWLPEVDPENRELLLSLGCFLENLILTARHRGLDIDYRVVGAIPSDTEILEVTLRRAEPSPFPLDKILLRRTVRSHHLRQELKISDVHALSAPFGDRLAFFPAGSANADWLSEQTIEANRVQANRDPAQEELSRWIRWADDEALRHRNGLTPESMEITGVSGWYVRHVMDQASVMKPSFRERSVAAVRQQLRSYGGWLVITSPDASMATLVETGRLFQRMWLGSRERMIAIHPMTQILEEAPFRNQVARQLGVSGGVQFILRTSYLARYPDPVSLRMPVSRFASGVNGSSASRASIGWPEPRSVTELLR
jgi:hypothetical protein